MAACIFLKFRITDRYYLYKRISVWSFSKFLLVKHFWVFEICCFYEFEFFLSSSKVWYKIQLIFTCLIFIKFSTQLPYKVFFYECFFFLMGVFFSIQIYNFFSWIFDLISYGTCHSFALRVKFSYILSYILLHGYTHLL